MKYNLNLLFVVRRAKVDQKGQVPIYMRISVNSERAELSISRKVDPVKWDSSSQRAKGRSEAAKTLNEYLDRLENSVSKSFNMLNENDSQISAAILRDMLIGKHEKYYTLISVFKKNNQMVKLEEGTKYTKDTVKRYEISIDRIRAFIHSEFHTDDIKLNDLNSSFIRKYEVFLRTTYECGHNTAMKYLKHLKKVIHFAMEMEYIDQDPFSHYKTAYKDVNRGYPTEAELLRIENHVFRIYRFDRVKDVFLFVCYTGLSYSDLKQLKRDSLSKGIDGKNWVIYEREKTGVQAWIPLLPKAQAIIDKYKDDPECVTNNKLIPVKSNQKLVSYLTEIAELCEINKNITMHLGRHRI